MNPFKATRMLLTEFMHRSRARWSHAGRFDQETPELISWSTITAPQSDALFSGMRSPSPAAPTWKTTRVAKHQIAAECRGIARGWRGSLYSCFRYAASPPVATFSSGIVSITSMSSPRAGVQESLEHSAAPSESEVGTEAASAENLVEVDATKQILGRWLTPPFRAYVSCSRRSTRDPDHAQGEWPASCTTP
jgi:hypothetical protein